MSISFLITITIAATLMALLYVILKYFQRFEVNNVHGLTFNYITASSFSFLNNYTQSSAALEHVGDILIYAFGIGLLFIVVFYIATLTAQYSGITITSIAGKMSMIIPIAGGILLFHELLNPARIIGIITALAAVVLSSYPSAQKEEESPANKRPVWILPLLLFIGSGMVDLCIKLSEHYLITTENRTLFISLLFGSAGIIGILMTLFNYFKNNIRIKAISILGGIVLGITNYYSLEFLITALSFPQADSSMVFSIANVFVVLISVIFALVLFKEKISRINFAGIFLAILSIIILSA
ncbi:MAG: hypothetical protein IPN36_13765 [Bacteroidetes bacterium]|nr:hypothetical protein [Bacteroidota bacterium]